MGIHELAFVKRKCLCYFCQDALEKGSMKFVYAHHKAKPARSIHTGCVFSMDAGAAKNSIPILQGLVASRSSTAAAAAAAKAACVKALSVLQPVAGDAVA